MEGIGIGHRRAEYCSWEEVEPPPEILEDIFSRLSVKTLLSCKSVCRRWRRLISAPSFTKLQLTRSRENPRYIIFTCDFEYTYVLRGVFLMDENGEICEVINLPGLEHLNNPYVNYSFNGLICCTNDVIVDLDKVEMEIRICNPATREVIQLPKCSPSAKEPSLGLACNPRNNEYKVYHFFSDAHFVEHNDYECEVYSSVTGLWRGMGRVSSHPMVGFDFFPSVSYYINVGGKVYWFMSSEKYVGIPGSILSVDENDNFRTIDLPEEVTGWACLMDVKGSLWLVTFEEREKVVKMFSLQDGDEATTWEVKTCGGFMLDDDIEVDYIESVAVVKSDVLFVVKDISDSHHYLLYNLDYHYWVTLDFNAFEQYSPALAFTESLLPCRGGGL